MVKSMKMLLTKCSPNGDIETEEFMEALIEYRNTPKKEGLSPSQLVFGHNMRSTIPVHDEAYKRTTSRDEESFKTKSDSLKTKRKEYYDRKAKNLPVLRRGQIVRVQNQKNKKWDKMGKITEIGKNRDNKVMLTNGQILWRNRIFIRPSY